MTTLYFQDDEPGSPVRARFESDITLEDLWVIYKAVRCGHADCRVTVRYRVREVMLDVRYLDAHKTFIQLGRTG